MRFLAFIVLSLIAAILPAQSEIDLTGLSSPEYRVRAQAQEGFLTWIFENPDRAKSDLLKLYLTTEDPEIRMRLIPALERAYFPPTKGYVGIKMRPLFLNQFGQLKGNQTRGKGIEIIQVMPGTPAEKSGLLEGDIIIEMDDWEVAGGLDLNDAFARRIQTNPPGVEIKLKIRRVGDEVNLGLKLSVLPTPSERARQILRSQAQEHPSIQGILPDGLNEEVEEFRFWLRSEIEKHAKSNR